MFNVLFDVSVRVVYFLGFFRQPWNERLAVHLMHAETWLLHVGHPSNLLPPVLSVHFFYVLREIFQQEPVHFRSVKKTLVSCNNVGTNFVGATGVQRADRGKISD